MSRRVRDWPDRLVAHVAAAEPRRFAWGRRDCALWVCDWIRVCVGIDPAAAVRDSYRNAREAAATLAALGFDDLAGCAATLAGRYGFAPVRAGGCLRRGDVGLITAARSPALVVVDASGQWLRGPGRHGLERYPLAAAAQGWEID